MARSRRHIEDAGAIFDARGPVSAAVVIKLGRRITELEAVIETVIVAIEEGRHGDALKALRSARRVDTANHPTQTDQGQQHDETRRRAGGTNLSQCQKIVHR